MRRPVLKTHMAPHFQSKSRQSNSGRKMFALLDQAFSFLSAPYQT